MMTDKPCTVEVSHGDSKITLTGEDQKATLAAAMTLTLQQLLRDDCTEATIRYVRKPEEDND